MTTAVPLDPQGRTDVIIGQATASAGFVVVATTLLVLFSRKRKDNLPSNLNRSGPTLAGDALIRPQRQCFPFVAPRGVMNLRPLRSAEESGTLLDVDCKYLVQQELKRVLLTTPSLVHESFGEMNSVPWRHPKGGSIESPTPDPTPARVWEASLEALGLVLRRLATEFPGIVECHEGQLVNVAMGRHWKLPPSERPGPGDADAHPLVLAALQVLAHTPGTTTHSALSQFYTRAISYNQGARCLRIITSTPPAPCRWAVQVQEDLALMLPFGPRGDLPMRHGCTENGSIATASGIGTHKNIDKPYIGGSGEGKKGKHGDDDGDDDGDDRSQYYLAAAAICFADAWSVPDKVGKSLHSIHAPAATYKRVAPATANFFAKLKEVKKNTQGQGGVV